VADTVFQHPISDIAPPNPPILAIAQDHDGFLWIGTEGGVGRWDGYRYRMYQSDPKSPGSLADNYIQSLHVDAQGRLWIATLSGGLSLYDRSKDRFINYAAGPDGLSSVDVQDITDDGNGGVWVATNHGLDDLDPERGVIGHLNHKKGDASSLPEGQVRTVLRDREGRIWIGMPGGVVHKDAPTGNLVKLSFPLPKGEIPGVTCLHEDGDGRIWVGTKHGAYVLQPGAPMTPQLVPATKKDWIESMAEGPRGEMWLGTYGEGILVTDERTFEARRIQHDPLLPQSLDEDTVWALYRDRAGDIWAGTNRGFSRTDPNQDAILSVFGILSRTRGLSDTDVEAVLSMPNGRLWLGLGAKGVDILDPLTGRVGHMSTGVDGTGKTWELSEVRDLISTDSGEVFICARGGLFRMTPQSPRPVKIPLPGNISVQGAALLPHTRRLWLGSLDDGLWTLDLDAAGRSRVQPYAGSNKLTDPRISALANGPSGSLWIGTFNGLNRLDPATGSVEQIKAIRETSTAIAAPYVSTLMTDREGRLWVGMQDGGISILDHRTPEGHPHFRHLGLADGLPNLNIDKILQAPSGAIWAATDDGLAVIDPDNYTIRSLKEAEGAAISSYWVNAGAVTADGLLAFGGAGGLTLIRPDRLRSYNDHPPILVTDVLVGGKSLPWEPFNDPGSPGTIEVTPDSNRFRVEFSALDYSAPERNRYSYWLQGYDRSWNQVDSRHRSATYTNLPPGSYILHLRGSNRDGVWTENQLSIAIRVQPKWYQTIAFKIAILLAALGLGIGVVQSRTAYLRARQRELERLVARQTAELRERERQLEQMAYSDLLTGLPNRRMFVESFNKVLALMRRQESKFALLLIDLDQFKLINDTLGHDAGDALLIETARRLRVAMRESDYIFRLGGDEFAILLVDLADISSIEASCHRVIGEFLEVFVFNGAEMKTSPSIGIATYPADGDSLESLCKVADLALYDAKKAGRNTWRWGQNQVSGHHEDSLSM
jgi:diguanylate cyclase (GGDEF)-like protein